jgi:uncharacterized protein YjbJ (UPF0337 family)
MGIPNKDEIKGKGHQAKGKVKETLGRAIDDERLEEEGKAERGKGHVQEQFGKARRKTGEALEDLGKAVGR